MKFIIFALIVSVGLGYAYYNFIGNEDVPLTKGLSILNENLAEKVESLSINDNPTIKNFKDKASDMANLAFGAVSENVVNNEELKQTILGVVDMYLSNKKVANKEIVNNTVQNLMDLTCSSVEDSMAKFFNGSISVHGELDILLNEMKNSGLSEEDIKKSVRSIYCQ